MSESITLSEGLLLYLILMASVILHEWTHAVVADRLGDPTPRLDGRTTLNPVAHFDLVGTCIMPLVIIFLVPFFAPFGWGKRIVLNPANFQKPKSAEILVWCAGPLLNLGLTLAVGFLGGLAFRFGLDLRTLVLSVIIINTILLVLNVLPFPPLDGGHVLRLLTDMREETFIRFSQWSFLILLGLILFVPPFRATVDFIFQLVLSFSQFAFSLASGGVGLIG